MLLLGRTSDCLEKRPGVEIPVVLSVSYNQPRKEGWKRQFVTRMKLFQREINSGRSAMPSPWTLSKERDTGPRVLILEAALVCLSLYQVLVVQVWPQVTGWSYTQTGSRNSSFSLDTKKNSTNQWERKEPQSGKRKRKQNKNQETSRKVQAVYTHSSWPKTREVGVTTELGEWWWGQSCYSCGRSSSRKRLWQTT